MTRGMKANDTPPDPNASCFLTTATVGALGLTDDCEPLQLARHLRDETMTEPRDRAAVDLYYRVAPTIVARSTDREWLGFWDTHMRDITTLIRRGEDDLARQLYTWATASLINRKATRYADAELVDEVYDYGLKGVGRNWLPYAARYVVLKMALSAGVAWHSTRLRVEKRRRATVLSI